jgi:hypothetical protein
VLLAVMLVIGNRGRDETNPYAVEPDAAAADSQEVARVARMTPPSPQEALPPAVEATTTPASEVTRDSPHEDLSAVIAGIDPLLRGRSVNLIVRAPDPKQTGPGFEELESRFGTERADPSWSPGMEARILEEVSLVDGLKLASLEAECRATICRLKLFHSAGTNALSSLGKLVPMATPSGFDHVARVATLDETGVPISLLYFRRERDATPR